MLEQFINNTFPTLQGYLSDWGISFSRNGIVWILIHLFIVFISIFIASYLGGFLQDKLEPKLRKIHGRPKLLRLLATFKRRLPVFVFIILIWSSVLVLKQMTWPSHGFTLTIIASLTTAWLIIELATKLIRNQFLAKSLGFIVWCVAALNILQVTPDAVAALQKTSVEIGDFHGTVLGILKGIFVFCFAVWGALYLGKMGERQLIKVEDLSPSHRVLIAKFLKVVLILIALLIGMGALGINYTALTVLGGAIGLGIGFGLKNIVSNLFGGVILLMDKSIKPGDVITVTSATSETFGKINYLAARYVSVVARDGREYLIPNEDLIINQVINWSFSSDLVRQDIHFGTSYDSDPYLVRELACKAAASHERVVTDKNPVCHITEFGDSSINFILRFWIDDPEAGVTNIKGDIFLSLWDEFKQNGIKIPYPHRQVLFDEGKSINVND